jgi:hypothetical protein
MLDSLGAAMIGGECHDLGCAHERDRFWPRAVWRPAAAKRGALLHQALVERPCPYIRRLAGGRARQVQFKRFLDNEAVTPEEMSAAAAAKTAQRVIGRKVIVVQDTTEVALGGKRRKEEGFGPVGRGGAARGLLLHVGLVFDEITGELIGALQTQVWNREGGSPVEDRHSREVCEKESQRWLDVVSSTGAFLGKALRKTVIADRESDIYEQFATRPSHVELIVRAGQNRRIECDDDDAASTLFPYVDSLPEAGRIKVIIPAAPGRKERVTTLAVRFCAVTLQRPRSARSDVAESVALHLVDVRETSTPADCKPIHWRLLTTHIISTVGEACEIVDLYRKRWKIEEFFRIVKTAGINIEDAQLTDPDSMGNFVAAAALASVTIMQCIQARDGNTEQPIEAVFEADDQSILEAVGTKLEGKTARQKNPHPKGSLAYAVWVIARLGGWDGYYGKPGPMVIRRGLHDYQQIKYGATLWGRNV